MSSKAPKLFYTALEVSQLLGVSVSSAYRTIKILNNELTEMGYIVLRGNVSKAYLDSKVNFKKEV